MTERAYAQRLEHSAPRYGGDGAANLMSSLRAALAPQRVSELPGCTLLPPEEILEHRHVVLLVVDGLGLHPLDYHAPEGFLASHRRGTLSAVFPSTTASAISTILTATTPATHGLLGWHTWLPRAGVIATPLPFTVRGAGIGLDAFGVSPGELFSRPPLLPAITRRVRVLHPQSLIDSVYTRAHAGEVERVGYRGLAALCEGVVDACASTRPGFVYAYWSELDHCSHVHGALSEATGAQLHEIDGALARLVERLSGTGTLLLVTADHGFVDTLPDTRLTLEEHPVLRALMRMPLTGEPRAVFCHLRPGALRELEDYVAEVLPHACEVVGAGDLLERGWLGPGEPEHPELRARMGDALLVMKEAYCLVDRLPGERPFELVGVHGGLSRQELDIPLVVAGEA